MVAAPALVAPLQRALLEDPLAFLSAEHARQTVLLGHLERVARAPLARAARVLAAMLLGWLTVELPTIDASETYRVIKTISTISGETSSTQGMIAAAAPAPVAIPLPPRSPRSGDQQCPATAAIAIAAIHQS